MAAMTAPGNAPWVVTVGASSHMGTVDRGDDTIAAFSSRGPAAVDYLRQARRRRTRRRYRIAERSEQRALCNQVRYLLNGTVPTSYLPYLSLSGTSMATPVVSATVALMLQANRALTPNLVKAIFQYTAEAEPGYHPLTQGAGFVNARAP